MQELTAVEQDCLQAGLEQEGEGVDFMVLEEEEKNQQDRKCGSRELL
jgi:hypothetical protein